MAISGISLSRRRLVTVLGGSALLLGYSQRLLASTTLDRFRIVQQDNVMLHVDLSHAVSNAKLFTLADPDRLVIDLPNTRLAVTLPQESFAQGVVKAIRYGVHEEHNLRIVVDLRRAITPAFQFINRQGGQRLLVDLGVKGNTALANYQSRVVQTGPLRDVVVAIDAGHGGKDPGAIGQRKTREKDITLSIARRLYKKLKSQQGIAPIMIREKDEYVALAERIRIARKQRVDLFVSIHADAVQRRAASGSSVYALSLKGASSEVAQWLAEKERETEALFGNVELEGLSQDLKHTLIDLAQNSTLEASLDVGTEVLNQLKAIGTVHKHTVEQANFAVLRSPDIPSILIETAFISNLREEKKLNSRRYQEKLATAIHSGIIQYFNRRAPTGTVLASMRQRAG